MFDTLICQTQLESNLGLYNQVLASLLQEINAVDFFQSLDLDVEGQYVASTSLCLFILGWAT